jgi:hypothetical protein
LGQYYLVANMDRKEFLAPDQFGEGIKLLAFGLGSGGTMTGLAILLAPSEGRRFLIATRHGVIERPTHPIIGRWAGQRIAIIGDYLMPDHAPEIDIPGEQGDLYFSIDAQEDGWVDISEHVIATMESVYGITDVRDRLERSRYDRLRHRSVLHDDGTVTALDTSPERAQLDQDGD